MKRAPVPLVEVEWLDAYSPDKSATREEVMRMVGLYKRVSIGYFLGQKDSEFGNVTVLAAIFDPPQIGHNEESNYDDITAVPTGWITRFKYLRGKPKKQEGENAEKNKPGRVAELPANPIPVSE